MLTETDDIDVLVSNWSNLFSLIIEKHAPNDCNACFREVLPLD